MAIGVADGSFAHPFVLPCRIATLQLLASPAFAFRVSIEVVVNANYSSVMVGYDFVGVNLLRRKLAAPLRDFEKIAANPVSGSDINLMIEIDRRRNHGSRTFPHSAPEQLAIGRRDTRDTLLGELDILVNSVDIDSDQRGIVRGICEFPALPDDVAHLLVEGDDRTARTTRRHQNLVSVTQGRFGKTPFRQPSTKILRHVFPPNLLAGCRLKTNQFAPLAQTEDKITIDRRRAPWSFKAAPAWCPCPVEFGLPGRFSIRSIQDQNKGVLVAITYSENPLSHDADARITFAQARCFQDQGRAAWRPAFEQAGFGGNAISIW